MPVWCEVTLADTHYRNTGRVVDDCEQDVSAWNSQET